MQPDLLRIAASYGCAFIADPRVVQAVLAGMEECERRSLVEATTIRFPNHPRRLADGLGDGMACDTKQHNDLS